MKKVSMLVACISVMFGFGVCAANSSKQKDCVADIYEAAERNFWDLNGDYFESYVFKVDPVDKQFFDKVIHYFDSFVLWEKKLGELEGKRNFPIDDLCQNDLFIATKMRFERNQKLVSSYRLCVKRLQKELSILNDSIYALPETKQRNNFIAHYKKGYDLYLLRFSSRLAVAFAAISRCGVTALGTAL